MCRTVEDTALMLQAMAGFDAEDYGSVNAPVPSYSDALHASTATLRLGVPREMYWEQLDPEIQSAAEAALLVLEGLSAGTTEMRLPAANALKISEPEAYAYHEPWLHECPEKYSPSIRERLLYGGGGFVATYINARREMDWWRHEIGKVFSDIDLIVTPTIPIKPVPAGTVSDLALIRNTNAFNVFGLPTISIPCGFSSEGLPVGLQITGPHLEEARVFQLAHAYEQAAGWYKRRPEL
jgi:aspartyl-tRNA(Asn)/glutamyl-tRNA(Gln) amidotransferase subunit A